MDILTIGEVLIDLTQTGKDARGIPQFAANPGSSPAPSRENDRDGFSMTSFFYAVLGWSAGFFWGFIPQNTAFMATTMRATTAMDTQKPRSRPSQWVVPNTVIQSSFQFMVFLLYSSSP